MMGQMVSILMLCCMAAARSVTITVNASEVLGPWIPLNRFFGCDEPNFAYYPRGQELLGELGAVSKSQTYFRTHNLLTTGNGSSVGVPALKFGSTNAYTEDEAGDPVYNFTIADRIFDAYLAANIKPYVQVGFMPLALANDPEPYFFDFKPDSSTNVIYTGWSHTPKSYQGWEELVYQWALHCLVRYGEEEVLSWYWEVWNEPNIAYWNGTTEQFYMLHDHAITGIKRAIPEARVGGCEVAGGASGTYLGDFLSHITSGTNFATGKTGTPLDFISFHAKGSPSWVNTTASEGFVRMNVSTQLRQIDEAFGIVASFPALKDTPIVLGEYDPDGCAACQTPAYGYRNGLLYPAYTAASFMRAVELAQRRSVRLEGALTWAFEYEKTELLPDGDQYFTGFRVLSTMGIDKPVLNAHRMLGMMSGQQIDAVSSGQVPLDVVLSNSVRGNQTDIGVVASMDGDAVSIFVWHYHDDNLEFSNATINLTIQGLPFYGQARMIHWRIDDEHSNAYQRWLEMGCPQVPSSAQHQELVEAGKLAKLEEPRVMDLSDEGLNVKFSLPIRSLSLIGLEAP
ncbi:glycoside hydrolase family 39 protein [Xylariaceae sp. FL0016]|nr:glycoside hydrolase family 39 protein [Xylariaceae sp. FL0016]